MRQPYAGINFIPQAGIYELSYRRRGGRGRGWQDAGENDKSLGGEGMGTGEGRCHRMPSAVMAVRAIIGGLG